MRKASMFTVPWRVCELCGERYTTGTPHVCDVDKRFVFEHEQERRREIAKEIEKADTELRTENVAATLALWEENATLPPCPDEDSANVSLDALRDFADWQREHEDGG